MSNEMTTEQIYTELTTPTYIQIVEMMLQKADEHKTNETMHYHFRQAAHNAAYGALAEAGKAIDEAEDLLREAVADDKTGNAQAQLALEIYKQRSNLTVARSQDSLTQAEMAHHIQQEIAKKKDAAIDE